MSFIIITISNNSPAEFNFPIVRDLRWLCVWCRPVVKPGWQFPGLWLANDKEPRPLIGCWLSAWVSLCRKFKANFGEIAIELKGVKPWVLAYQLLCRPEGITMRETRNHSALNNSATTQYTYTQTISKLKVCLLLNKERKFTYQSITVKLKLYSDFKLSTTFKVGELIKTNWTLLKSHFHFTDQLKFPRKVHEEY